MAQREEVIKRTVYVSDIDQQVKVMLACVLPFFFLLIVVLVLFFLCWTCVIFLPVLNLGH